MHHRPFMIEDALRGVLRRKALVLSFFTATVLLVGLITVVTPKSYTSQARLFLRLGRENSSLDATATLGEHPVVMMPQSRQAEINSVVELLQAKQIYEAVVTEIGTEPILERDYVAPEDESTLGQTAATESWLDEVIGQTFSYLAAVGILNDLPRQEKAVLKLQKDFDIEAFEESNVITVSFETHSPQLAQRVVDSTVRNYIHEHVRLHRSVGADRFLAEETKKIYGELSAREEELELLKNRSGILSSDLHRAKMIERIATLETELMQAEAEASALQTEVEQLMAGLSIVSPTHTVSETIGAGNEGADGMRQELFRLEMAYQDLMATYKPTHPKARKMEEQLDQSRKVLTEAELGRREQTQGPNQVFQEASIALMLKRPALAAIQARIAKTKEQIEQFNMELRRFTKDEIQFAGLDREIAILDASYRKYAANLQHAMIDEKMKAEEFSNIGIAQPASLNLKPAKPNKLINLLLGIFLGGAGGIALAVLLEYFHPRLNNVRDIEGLLELPVVATIPKLSRANLQPKLPGALDEAEVKQPREGQFTELVH